ncbi:MAG: hypothetical protein NTZ21_14360 [Actinobacteria bacterium]|nr:hypothetical protein [Actinomycetota bacterium]
MSIDVDAPDVAYVGERMVLAVTVVNDGPSRSATPVTMTVALPVGVEIVAVDGGVDAWSCDGRSATIVCTAPDGIAPDTSSVLSLTASVGPATETDDVAVTAMLTADPADTATEDDVDVDTVDVRPGESTGSTGSAAPATSAPGADAEGSMPVPATTPATPMTPRDFRAADLLGFGGAAGALAFAVVLVSGRRRRGW